MKQPKLMGCAMGVLLSRITAAFSEPARITGTANVVDGDTIDIGTARIRLHGIDAPEDGQICEAKDGHNWSCGSASTNRLASWTNGQEVECLALGQDQYGRVIGICYLDGIDMNAALVREGLAWAFTRFSDDYIRDEAIAKEARLGIWQADNTPAWVWRTQNWDRTAAASPDGYRAKGNINRHRERIDHMLWYRWRDRVQIDKSKI